MEKGEKGGKFQKNNRDENEMQPNRSNTVFIENEN